MSEETQKLLLNFFQKLLLNPFSYLSAILIFFTGFLAYLKWKGFKDQENNNFFKKDIIKGYRSEHDSKQKNWEFWWIFLWIFACMSHSIYELFHTFEMSITDINNSLVLFFILFLLSFLAVNGITKCSGYYDLTSFYIYPLRRDIANEIWLFYYYFDSKIKDKKPLKKNDIPANIRHEITPEAIERISNNVYELEIKNNCVSTTNNTDVSSNSNSPENTTNTDITHYDVNNKIREIIRYSESRKYITLTDFILHPTDLLNDMLKQFAPILIISFGASSIEELLKSNSIKDAIQQNKFLLVLVFIILVMLAFLRFRTNNRYETSNLKSKILEDILKEIKDDNNNN